MLEKVPQQIEDQAAADDFLVLRVGMGQFHSGQLAGVQVDKPAQVGASDGRVRIGNKEKGLVQDPRERSHVLEVGKQNSFHGNIFFCELMCEYRPDTLS